MLFSDWMRDSHRSRRSSDGSLVRFLDPTVVYILSSEKAIFTILSINIRPKRVGESNWIYFSVKSILPFTFRYNPHSLLVQCVLWMVLRAAVRQRASVNEIEISIFKWQKWKISYHKRMGSKLGYQLLRKERRKSFAKLFFIFYIIWHSRSYVPVCTREFTEAESDLWNVFLHFRLIEILYCTRVERRMKFCYLSWCGNSKRETCYWEKFLLLLKNIEDG